MEMPRPEDLPYGPPRPLPLPDPPLLCPAQWNRRLDPYLSQQCNPRDPYGNNREDPDPIGAFYRKREERERDRRSSEWWEQHHERKERERQQWFEEQQQRREEERREREEQRREQAYFEEQQRREREAPRIWERTLPDNTRLIGVTGDRSHTHYGDDFVAIRAEDQPRVHLRWRRNLVTGEYDD